MRHDQSEVRKHDGDESLKCEIKQQTLLLPGSIMSDTILNISQNVYNIYTYEETY